MKSLLLFWNDVLIEYKSNMSWLFNHLTIKMRINENWQYGIYFYYDFNQILWELVKMDHMEFTFIMISIKFSNFMKVNCKYL
jgi:hypothetical protein